MIIKFGIAAIIIAFLGIDSINQSDWSNILKIQHYWDSLDRYGMWTNGLYSPINVGRDAPFDVVLSNISSNQSGRNSIWSQDYKIVYVMNSNKICNEIAELYNAKNLYEFILVKDNQGFWICVLHRPDRLNVNGGWWNRFIKIN